MLVAWLVSGRLLTDMVMAAQRVGVMMHDCLVDNYTGCVVGV